MENKINIAELLKDCPQGMELDCAMFEGIEFDGIVDAYFPIRCRVKHPDGGYNVYNFTEYGCWTTNDFAKCVIFPKGKTTWDGFVPPYVFKDGDIVAAETDSGLQVFILQKAKSDYQGYCYIGYDFVFNNVFDAGEWVFDRLATEEEKQKFFQAIKENGYKWNPETKTLEKFVEHKFKDGDILYAMDEGKEFIFILKHIFLHGRVYCYLSLKGDDLRLQEVWLTDYNPTHRLATEDEKQKLFDAIKSKGYKWNAENKTLEKLTESNEDVDDEILMSGIYFDRKYYADEVELHLDNYNLEIRDGRVYAVFKNQIK